MSQNKVIMVAYGQDPKVIDDPQLVSCSLDDEIWVAKKVLEKSALLKGLMEDVQNDAGPIPLRNVEMNVLLKVLDWADHHLNDPETDAEEGSEVKKSLVVEKWDETFLNVDQEMLFEIILAANYLDIQALLDTACKTVARMIKGNSPEEIRKKFNIFNDFTPEEEARIKKENEWAEDK